jgi:hypothetical protein
MIWTFLMTKLGRILSSILFVVSAIAAIFLAGKRDEKKARQIEDLRDYKETKEKIDETPVTRTRDAAAQRLRDNDQIR